MLLLVAAVLVSSLTPSLVQAQTQPATSYSFGDAKAHTHNNFNVEYGRYCGRWVFNDPTNNGGNAFLGNAICVEHWLTGETWYWYDWSANVSDSLMKISTWRIVDSNLGPATNIYITYDQTCLLVTVASTDSPFQSMSTQLPFQSLNLGKKAVSSLRSKVAKKYNLRR